MLEQGLEPPTRGYDCPRVRPFQSVLGVRLLVGDVVGDIYRAFCFVLVLEQACSQPPIAEQTRPIEFAQVL
jgi:hypothetical protein